MLQLLLLSLLLSVSHADYLVVPTFDGSLTSITLSGSGPSNTDFSPIPGKGERFWFGTSLQSHKAILCGGEYQNEASKNFIEKECYLFDATKPNDSWTYIGDQITPRRSTSIMSIPQDDHSVQVLWTVGGLDQDFYSLDSTEVIIIYHGTITILDGPKLPIPLANTCATYIAPNVYFVTGLGVSGGEWGQKAYLVEDNPGGLTFTEVEVSNERFDPTCGTIVDVDGERKVMLAGGLPLKSWTVMDPMRNAKPGYQNLDHSKLSTIVELYSYKDGSVVIGPELPKDYFGDALAVDKKGAAHLSGGFLFRDVLTFTNGKWEVRDIGQISRDDFSFYFSDDEED